ncbi:MAG: hypothetical protein QOE09_1450 [Ilumatobacteraceae bacterium]|jgi:hypothetical protein
MTNGDDPWDVFVCHVPENSRSPTYAGLSLRVPLTPNELATVLNAKVSAYFETLSHGAYRPRFTAAGEVAIASSDEPQACVDHALAVDGGIAQGVIVIADAEHNATVPGGFANRGSTCSGPPCPASTTRRSAYVGAADFNPEWAGKPPMDLVEHEIGHALGWPHSGYDASRPDPEQSALDVMSNSAAPRDVHPARRDAPDTLAINRLSAGWLPSSAVHAVAPSGGTVTLSPSAGASGTRLAVVALDERRFIAVELLTADGFDDHLPASGIAVHLISGAGTNRVQAPLVGPAPYIDLLTAGETLSSNGWSVSVATGWRVTIKPAGSVPTVSG